MARFFILISLTIGAHSFFSPWTRTSFLGKGALRSQVSKGEERISNSGNKGILCGDVDNGDWNTHKDWLLQDKVPMFTIEGCNREVTTFWTQLRYSTPDLSYQTERELEDRYRTIMKQKLEIVSPETTRTSTMIQCGPSPQLLTHWRTEHSKNSSKNSPKYMFMSGTLSNGSKVWFPLQRAGILGGQPWIDEENNSGILSSPEMPLDFAEAIGGCVYELGLRSPSQSPIELNQVKHSMFTFFRGHIDGHHMNTNQNIESLQIRPWLTSRNGSMFAIAVASILSAMIAFGADPCQPPQIQQSNTGASTPTMTVRTVPAVATPAYVSVDASELSIGAQRARQELKVERDRMTISRVQDRLKLDEVKLQELQKQETRQEAIKYGFQK